jgi:ADP-heptose:LPS heptosyltransferase
VISGDKQIAGGGGASLTSAPGGTLEARNPAWSRQPEWLPISPRKRAFARHLDRVGMALRAMRRRKARENSGQHVLILEPFGLGDVISHEPMIRRLQDSNFRVSFCGGPEWKPLFPNVNWVESFVPWGRHARAEKYAWAEYSSSEFRKFLFRLRATGRDAVGIDTRGDIRSVLLLYMAGCREVITTSSYVGSDLRISPSAATVVEVSRTHRRWESNLRCLQPLGIEQGQTSPPAFPHLRVSASQTEQTIGLMPVAPWRGKLWIPERWQALSNLLRREGWQVRALCGPRQAESAALAVGKTVEVVECTSVEEWSLQLGRLQALVTLDSGPMHLADALGTPVIALFGQGLLPLWAPSGRLSQVVTYQNDPQFKPLQPIEPNTEEAQGWMRRITVEDVMEALARVVSATKSHSLRLTAGP